VETGIIKSQVGAVVKIGARVTGEIMKMNVKIGDNSLHLWGSAYWRASIRQKRLQKFRQWMS
jgi:hypothetical protein